MAAALLLSPMQAPGHTRLTDYVGTYADGPTHTIEIAVDAKGQLVAVIDDAIYQLKVTAQDEVTNNGGERIPFKRDIDGQVSGYIDDGQVHKKLSSRVPCDIVTLISTPARPAGEVYKYGSSGLRVGKNGRAVTTRSLYS